MSDSTGASSELEETQTFIKVNKSNLTFAKGTLLPGSVEELDVTMQLKDDVIEFD